MADEKELTPEEKEELLNKINSIKEDIKSAWATCLDDSEKRLKEKHKNQQTFELQFCPSDNTGAQSKLVDSDEDADGNNFFKMALIADDYLIQISSGEKDGKQHIVAYGAERHPAFASILARECFRFNVGLTLVYKDENGRLYELPML